MAQLRSEYEKFLALDTVVVVVGPENEKEFRKFWSENDMPFIGLPDPKHKVLKLYGQEVNIFKLGRMPAMVIVDKKGQARFVHYGHQMSDIPTNQEVLGALEEINS